MGKKELSATLGAVFIGAGLSYMLEHPFPTCQFFIGLMVLLGGIVLTFPILFAQTRLEAFRAWLDKTIEQGENLYKSELIDEVARKDYEYDYKSLIDDYIQVHNVWNWKRKKVLRSVFGKEDLTWQTLDSQMETDALQYINNPLIWGGYRRMLRVEIQHLKMLKNMITTSEYFQENFSLEILNEIEADQPLSPKLNKLVRKTLK